MKTNSKTQSLINRVAAAALAFVVAIGVYLNVPPPRHAHAFEAQSTWGGAGGGTANAQNINLANVQSLSDLIGVPIRYVPAINNTGPATLMVNGVNATTVVRPSSIGLVGLSGGELQFNVTMTLMYNGTNFEIQGPLDMRAIGSTVEVRGSTAPRGTLIEDGSCVSTTTYAALFSVIGNTYGSCGGGLFKLPFSNGEAFVAMDTQGTATANRITSAGSGCNATTAGDCGSQSTTLVTSNLPAYTPAGGVGITDPGHAHDIAYNSGSGNGTSNYPSAPTSTQSNSVSNNIWAGGGSAGLPAITNTTGITAGFSGSPQGGTSTPFSKLLPISIGIRAIKF